MTTCLSLNQLGVIRNILCPHLFHPFCGSYHTRPPNILILPCDIFWKCIYVFVSGFYPAFPPYTFPSSGDSATISDGFVGVAIESRPLVRVLIPVQQPMGEDGIGVSVVSVRPVTVVGVGRWSSWSRRLRGVHPWRYHFLPSGCPSWLWWQFSLIPHHGSAFSGRTCSCWPRLVSAFLTLPVCGSRRSHPHWFCRIYGIYWLAS